MKCPNCSTSLEKDSKFCQSCGYKVEKEENLTASDIPKKMLDHLEFLGYEIEKIGSDDKHQRYLAKHDNRGNLAFNSVIPGGISFVCFYNLNKVKIEKDKTGILEIINRMNNQGLFCSFSLSPDFNSLVCASLYYGEYDKKWFANFLDIFENDIQGRLRAENYLPDFT